jgi:hypothetical protein
MAKLHSVSQMEALVGYEVVDSRCPCGKLRRIYGSKMRPYLGCSDRDCKQPLQDLFRDFNRLPDGAVWEDGVPVFYRDELGEPIATSVTLSARP